MWIANCARAEHCLSSSIVGLGAAETMIPREKSRPCHLCGSKRPMRA
jgi:hypothetical protein